MFSLGRRVEHDPLSRNFPYPVELAPPKTVLWPMNSKVLDQGDLGACTGFALAQLLNTERYWLNRMQGWRSMGKKGKRFLRNDNGVDFYSLATHMDEFPGEYPPNDTGSSGLGVAKAGVARHFLTRYMHTFSFTHFLAALANGPVLAGTNWYANMCYPNEAGFVNTGGQLLGGHEYVVLGCNYTRGYITGLCAWTSQYGLNGRFRVDAEQFERLLNEEGDVTVPELMI